ncbi:hypothetical protein ALI144C_52855 [Actinosynnema sp. ALI-1.44]|nr:hypothetical protein ALI144C_52855 [Actinosynnema sp. ALI-1.44]
MIQVIQLAWVTRKTRAASIASTAKTIPPHALTSLITFLVASLSFTIRQNKSFHDSGGPSYCGPYATAG